MTLFEKSYYDVAGLVRKFEEHKDQFQRERDQRKCEYLDGEIDRLVYELYGITAEEIKIVEGNRNGKD